MWRNKKMIVVAVLAAVLLIGSTAGIALAQSGNGDAKQPDAKFGAMLDKVCEIYQQKTGVAIDQQALKDAFAQAGKEMRPAAPLKARQNFVKKGPEAMMQDHLNKLVGDGKITQEQANAFLKWWQSKPDVSFGFGFPGGCGPRGAGGPPPASTK